MGRLVVCMAIVVGITLGIFLSLFHINLPVAFSFSICATFLVLTLTDDMGTGTHIIIASAATVLAALCGFAAFGSLTAALATTADDSAILGSIAGVSILFAVVAIIGGIQSAKDYAKECNLSRKEVFLSLLGQLLIIIAPVAYVFHSR